MFFLKTCHFSKFLHYGFRILQYETRTRMMSSDYFKSRTRIFKDEIFFKKFESKQTKKTSNKILFSNRILEHFFKIVQKISQNFSKLVLKITPSKPLIDFKMCYH